MSMPKTSQGIPDNSIYRVKVDPDTKSISIFCFGSNAIDRTVNDFYIGVEDLPIWLQRKLSVLAGTSPKPPEHEVVGVGRRIDENVFWVYYGDES